MNTFLKWACDEDGEHIWIRLDLVLDPDTRREVASCTCTADHEENALEFNDVVRMVASDGGWWGPEPGVELAHPEEDQQVQAYAYYCVVYRDELETPDPYTLPVPRPGQGTLL